MTNAEARIVHLEQLLRKDELAIAALQAAVAALQQAVRTGQPSPYGGGGGGVYSIPAVVISAGGNVTGKTVSTLVGGALTTVNANATVYNQMHSATVSTSGLTIMVGANADGTYSAISQSC